MRVWDIETKVLCNNHLLGEHREIHAIWKILTENKKGYAHHPETLRWKGKLLALYNRHETVVAEMIKRGFNHKSTLKKELAIGSDIQSVFIDQPDRQRMILLNKQCNAYCSTFGFLEISQVLKQARLILICLRQEYYNLLSRKALHYYICNRQILRTYCRPRK